ncbi:MAG: DNA repair and recombination protein RadA [Candidatus Hadarchaeales archaeon]
MEIEELQSLSPSVVEKLRAAGFSTISQLATATATELMHAAEISMRSAIKIINSARDAIKLDYQLASELYERRKNIDRLTTGSTALDKILGGGLESGSVTEVFGEFGSGKSQLAHQLCVNVQLPRERGGLEGNAIYIDTEGTFRPERIVQMASALGLDPAGVLEKIHAARALTTDHQILLVERIGEICRKEPVRLLVVDSVSALFRTEFCGRGTLAERQQKLGRHIAALHNIAERHNVVVFVTNQVQARPDVMFGDPTRPVGGHVLGHAVTVRIYLKKAKDDARIAKLVDHPCLPPESTTIRITPEGIRD